MLFLKRDFDLKNNLYSKGTYIIEGTMHLRPFLISNGHYNRKETMVLKTLLIPKGQKKEMKRKITR